MLLIAGCFRRRRFKRRYTVVRPIPLNINRIAVPEVIISNNVFHVERANPQACYRAVGYYVVLYHGVRHADRVTISRLAVIYAITASVYRVVIGICSICPVGEQDAEVTSTDDIVIHHGICRSGSVPALYSASRDVVYLVVPYREIRGVCTQIYRVVLIIHPGRRSVCPSAIMYDTVLNRNIGCSAAAPVRGYDCGIETVMLKSQSVQHHPTDVSGKTESDTNAASPFRPG